MYARLSIEYLGEHSPARGWIRDALSEARIEGGDTVAFTFGKPCTRLDFEFASYNIFPKHVRGGTDDPMRHGNPEVTTGLYAFDRRLNTGLVLLGMSLNKAPLSERLFREALSYAIDYVSFLERSDR